MNEYTECKDEYISPYSNLQIFTLCNLSKKNKLDILSRLISLTMKRFNSRLYEKVYNILNQNTNDINIYNELYILYNSSSNKIPKFIKRPNKNIAIINTLLLYIKHFIQFDFEKKSLINYLDVGAGNGRFCKMFGKGLKLENNNIHGIDIPSFSEQGDWNRNETMNDIVFTTINKNDKYPYFDNKFDIITMKMVFHHIENIDLTLSEIARVLRNDGYLILIEHDAHNYLDYILCEIEHLYYIKVFNKNKNGTNKDDMNKDIDSLGYMKFRNIKETNEIVSNYGFNELQSVFVYEINENTGENIISPTRNYWTIYQLNK
jgi:ubiquinone/menaquinone biosynthesis C-methylase UbiE